MTNTNGIHTFTVSLQISSTLYNRLKDDFHSYYTDNKTRCTLILPTYIKNKSKLTEHEIEKHLINAKIKYGRGMINRITPKSLIKNPLRLHCPYTYRGIPKIY